MMVVPAENVEATLDELVPLLGDGDIIIGHGNSNFKDSRRRERLSKLGIQYLDCGTSGGVYGLDRGYCLMVGGNEIAVAVYAPIFRALRSDLPLPLAQIQTYTRSLQSMVGCTVVDLVPVTS